MEKFRNGKWGGWGSTDRQAARQAGRETSEFRANPWDCFPPAPRNCKNRKERGRRRKGQKNESERERQLKITRKGWEREKKKTGKKSS